jgi:hypothetical protein
MDISNIKDIVDKVFSEKGYSVNSLTFYLPQLTNIAINKSEKELSLEFVENFPKVSWKKFITLSTYLQDVTLGETGGSIKLRYIPRIQFSYGSALVLDNFGSQLNFDDVKDEIITAYPDTERKKLALLCLQYGSEWATIASQSEGFYESTAQNKRHLKLECKKFIESNIKENSKSMHGSVILSFILLYVILPVVLKFVLERLFNKLFN